MLGIQTKVAGRESVPRALGSGEMVAPQKTAESHIYPKHDPWDCHICRPNCRPIDPPGTTSMQAYMAVPWNVWVSYCIMNHPSTHTSHRWSQPFWGKGTTFRSPPAPAASDCATAMPFRTCGPVDRPTALSKGLGQLHQRGDQLFRQGPSQVLVRTNAKDRGRWSGLGALQGPV